LWGWRNSEVYKRKLDTPAELLEHVLDAAGSTKNMKSNIDQQNAIFANELQSAGRWTVGFANIYCEL
jgi:hypothetical protein